MMTDHNVPTTARASLADTEAVPQNPFQSLLNSPVAPEDTVALSEYSRNDPDYLARARAAVVTILGRCGMSPDKIEAGELCTSEVAGNVIAHTTGKITYLAVHRGVGAVAISIGATGPLEGDISEHPTLPDEDAEGGRGGFIVDFLTEAHGSRKIAEAPSPETSQPTTTTEHWFVIAA